MEPRMSSQKTRYCELGHEYVLALQPCEGEISQYRLELAIGNQQAAT